jgi:hypothetical protein
MIGMTLPLRIGRGLLLMAFAATCGCGGVQDSDQPAMGSISVKSDKDNDTPITAPGKKAPANRK